MEESLTKKFREAIRNKLLEYDAYLDDELPDYIMVMVANKKTKESMESDLSLFLGKYTKKFTTWLHEMIDKVEATADDSLLNSIPLSDLSEDVISLAEEDDILADDTQTQSEDISLKELHNEVAVNSCSKDEKVDDICTMPNEKEPIRMKMRKNVTIKLMKKSSVKSKLVPMKRLSNVLDEYDPMNPSVKSVASVVHMGESKRKIPRIQANKLLLFKAIEDANKSVMGKQNIEEMYKPTPIKMLTSSLQNTTPNFSSHESEIRVPCSQESPKKNSTNYGVGEVLQHSLINSVNQEITPTIEYYEPSSIYEDIIDLHGETDFEDMEVLDTEVSEELPLSGGSSPAPSSPSARPHFVVTLDGLNANPFKDKWEPDLLSESGNDSANDLNPEAIPEEQNAKTEKMADRCRYWPVCKNGESCVYFHPKFPCKTFPNCKYGDKCHFIHPNCKFDSLCSRKDCPFTHKNGRDLTNISNDGFVKPPFVRKQKATVTSYRTIACKFYPKCNSYNCPYSHPKMCKFGMKCKSLKCPFIHPSFPTRHQMKWKAVSPY